MGSEGRAFRDSAREVSDDEGALEAGGRPPQDPRGEAFDRGAKGGQGGPRGAKGVPFPLGPRGAKGGRGGADKGVWAF